MEEGKIDRRKLMDDTKLARLAKAREKKEELRLKRESDKLDLLKKKVLVEMGQQEMDSVEKAKLKEEKWNRRKAEMFEEFRNLTAVTESPKKNGKASRSTKAVSPRKKASKYREPSLSEEDSGESSEECDDGGEEECIQLF